MGKKQIDYPASLAFRVSSELADIMERLSKEYQLRVSDVLREFLPPEQLLATFLDCIQVCRDESTCGKASFEPMDEPWALCREFIERGIRDKMLNDQYWPISRVEFVGKTEGEALYRLFSEWTKAQYGVCKKYALLAVTEDGQTRYRLGPKPKRTTPRLIATHDYDKSQRQTLAAGGLDEKQIDEFMKNLKKHREIENKKRKQD